jgi:hypothetical protein
MRAAAVTLDAAATATPWCCGSKDASMTCSASSSVSGQLF